MALYPTNNVTVARAFDQAYLDAFSEEVEAKLPRWDANNMDCWITYWEIDIVEPIEPELLALLVSCFE